MKNSPLAFFEHEKFGSLRVVRSDQGAQWFVAKDVCGCLGLNTSNLSKMLDEDELSTYPRTVYGSGQESFRRIRTGPVFPHPAFPQARSQGVQAVGDT